MSVDRAHAERIAHLARLRLDADELGHITSDLNRILEHVESLEGLEDGMGHLATGGAPTVADQQSTRAAGAEHDALARPIAELAPDWRQGFFVVPPLPGVHETDGGSA